MRMLSTMRWQARDMEAAGVRRRPQAVRDHLAALRELTMFVVQRLGPTSFLVREEGSEVKRRRAEARR